MDLQLSGDVAVVVGGAKGIGRAIASAFVAEGANVVIVDRDPDGPSVAKELAGKRAGPRVRPTSRRDGLSLAIVEVAEQVRRDYGRCDHVVFAAGIGSGKFGFPFWNLEPGDWDRVLRVNLIGAANVAHAFAPSPGRGSVGHDAVHRLGRRPDRLADRPALIARRRPA